MRLIECNQTTKQSGMEGMDCRESVCSMKILEMHREVMISHCVTFYLFVAPNKCPCFVPPTF